MKKFIIPILSVIILCGIGVHIYWLDGVSGYLCEIVFGDTVYSAEYSESKFRTLKTGMTEDQVLALLGEPLFKNSYYPDVWFYSYGKPVGDKIWVTNSNYTQRIVEFKDGVLVRIEHDFYFD